MPSIKKPAEKISRRIYVSMPADRWLTDEQNRLKWAIVNEVKNLGYVPEIFTNPRRMPGLASGKPWNARDAFEIARGCSGAVIIGMPRWKFKADGGNGYYYMPTDFCSYEGALAHAFSLPMLIVKQDTIAWRTVFDNSHGHYISTFTGQDDERWLTSEEFQTGFYYWQEKLQNRRDVFLGYSSKSAKLALQVKQYLGELGATVLDWNSDFIPASSIMEQIKKAADRCTGGVFLFTKDDNFLNNGKGESFAPRDNVVFEAGYFIHAKDKSHVLIVREEGAKMLADLGGDIYAHLPNRNNIDPIKNTIKGFIMNF